MATTLQAHQFQKLRPVVLKVQLCQAHIDRFYPEPEGPSWEFGIVDLPRGAWCDVGGCEHGAVVKFVEESK